MDIHAERQRKARVSPFGETHHVRAFQSWLRAYDFPATYFEHVPEIGFMAEDDEGCIAAGFLRRIERSEIALFDGLIANPLSFGKRRYFAIDEVVQRLLEEAETLHLKQIIAFSIDTGTLKRSKKHGFEVVPRELVALALA